MVLVMATMLPLLSRHICKWRHKTCAEFNRFNGNASKCAALLPHSSLYPVQMRPVWCRCLDLPSLTWMLLPLSPNLDCVCLLVTPFHCFMQVPAPACHASRTWTTSRGAWWASSTAASGRTGRGTRLHQKIIWKPRSPWPYYDGDCTYNQWYECKHGDLKGFGFTAT